MEQLVLVTAALAVPGVVLDIVSSSGLTALHIVSGALVPSPPSSADSVDVSSTGGGSKRRSRRASLEATAPASSPSAAAVANTTTPGKPATTMVCVEVAKKLIEVCSLSPCSTRVVLGYTLPAPV